MIGMFRVLCVGYGIFAIANCIMLFLLYFASNTDAMWAAISFFVFNAVGTFITIKLSDAYYGFGFVIASAIFYFIGLRFLFSYIDHLDFHIFTNQPVFFIKKKGFLTRLVERLEAKEAQPES